MTDNLKETTKYNSYKKYTKKHTIISEYIKYDLTKLTYFLIQFLKIISIYYKLFFIDLLNFEFHCCICRFVICSKLGSSRRSDIGKPICWQVPYSHTQLCSVTLLPHFARYSRGNAHCRRLHVSNSIEDLPWKREAHVDESARERYKNISCFH